MLREEVKPLRKLTVREYAQDQGVAEKTVYQWIRSNKVKHIKETRNNQEVTVILVDTVQNEVKPSSDHVEQNNPLQNTNKELIEFMGRMTQYIEMAGQVKLLTDSESKTKEEYFKTIQENAQLKAKLELTQKSLEELQNKMNSSEENRNSLTK